LETPKKSLVCSCVELFGAKVNKDRRSLQFSKIYLIWRSLSVYVNFK
jgi:hypothetical protein